MKLSELRIKNFRNFDEVSVSLSNKNLVFGMNDVGKSNFLCAIRFLLDYKFRNKGFSKSDFHNYNVSEPIEITLIIELETNGQNYDNNSEKLIAKLHGARGSDENNVYIKLKANYIEHDDRVEPHLYWGTDEDDLSEIPTRGISYLESDTLFEVVYFEPNISMKRVFKSNKNKIFNEREQIEEDSQIIKDIEESAKSINRNISDLSVVKNFEEDINLEYGNLRKEDFSIKLKSEIAVNKYYDYIVPYITHADSEEDIYPTSGDGRQKVISYALLNYLNKSEKDDKIKIFLIEEPENSLHRSMIISLSRQLFAEDSIYDYFFLTTHSNELLYELDYAALIRLYNSGNTKASSVIFHHDEKQKNIKRRLNKQLSSAFFANKILLVEGPSEAILIDSIFEALEVEYELDGGFILETNGIDFSPYVNKLSALGINCFVKTDNDIKKVPKSKPNMYSLIGINRCIRLVEGTELESREINNENRLEIKKSLYSEFEPMIHSFEGNNIYLSKIDLENDLFEIIPDKMQEIFGNNPIDTLQKAKKYNMIELVDKLEKEDFNAIYKHENFKVIKRFNEYGK